MIHSSCILVVYRTFPLCLEEYPSPLMALKTNQGIIHQVSFFRENSGAACWCKTEAMIWSDRAKVSVFDVNSFCWSASNRFNVWYISFRRFDSVPSMGFRSCLSISNVSDILKLHRLCKQTYSFGDHSPIHAIYKFKHVLVYYERYYTVMETGRQCHL